MTQDGSKISILIQGTAEGHPGVQIDLLDAGWLSHLGNNLQLLAMNSHDIAQQFEEAGINIPNGTITPDDLSHFSNINVSLVQDEGPPTPGYDLATMTLNEMSVMERDERHGKRRWKARNRFAYKSWVEPCS